MNIDLAAVRRKGWATDEEWEAMLAALERTEQDRDLQRDHEIEARAYQAVIDEQKQMLERFRQHLREKNDIIRAYAGPGGMSPEDTRAAVQQRDRYREALQRIRTGEDMGSWAKTVAHEALNG